MSKLLIKRGIYTAPEFEKLFLEHAGMKSDLSGLSFIRGRIADYYNIHPDALLEKTNSWTIARPRMVAMYLTVKLLGYSLPRTGRCFGGKHHTTVIHAIEQTEARMHRNPKFDAFVRQVMDEYLERERSL